MVTTTTPSSPSRSSISQLFSRGSWFKTFFKPRKIQEVETEEPSKTKEVLTPETPKTVKTIPNADARAKVPNTTDGANPIGEENERGRRGVDSNLPPNKGSAASTATPNKGGPPPPPTGQFPIRRIPSSRPSSRPAAPNTLVTSQPRPVDGVASPPAGPPPSPNTGYRNPWFHSSNTPYYPQQRPQQRPQQLPQQLPRRPFYYSSAYTRSSSSSSAFPNRVPVPNRRNYPNSHAQYSPYDYMAKDPHAQSNNGQAPNRN
jgi:hypothetical protein